MEDLTHLGQPPKDSGDSEESLIARYITTGDELAFKAVYDRYWDELNNFVHHHLVEASAAEVDKMLQQASHGLHRCRSRFLPGAHVRPMLYSIVEYHCNDYIRVAEARRRDYCAANPCSKEQIQDRIDSDLGNQR